MSINFNGMEENDILENICFMTQQTWADAFKGRSEMKEINKIYLDLKGKGVEFPMTDMEHMVPIHTPSRVSLNKYKTDINSEQEMVDEWLRNK